MGTYVFKAMDLAGVKARGELEADSKQAVSDQLKQRGLIVLEIADKHASREIELPFTKTVNASELAVFSRQLATMITSGMSILRALYVLEWQTENKFLKETIVAVRKDVEAGLSLSDSLARHPKVFNPLFVAMTQAGEAGGVLEDALLRVADQLEKDASLRRQIRSAMVYPALVVVFAVGVMMALVAFLVPVFEGVFKQFGGELPKITQVSLPLPRRHRLLVADLRARGGLDRRLHQVEGLELGPAAVGPLPPADPDEDRHDRAAGRRGALGADAGLADERRRAAAAGAGHHRPHRRERGRRGGDGGVIASVKRGGTIAAPLAQAPIFPVMVTHMVGSRRGNGRAGRDARQGRGVLRGPGGSVGEGADLDPRADHDHRHRRDRSASS